MNKLFRNFTFMRGGDLDEIAEHVIEFDFQCADACVFGIALLHLRDNLFGVAL